MMLALTATLAIVVQDHAALRAAPRANGTELARVWQGEVLEVRGEQAGYLKVYDHRLERGGYLQGTAGRAIEISENAAPELLAVMRFLQTMPGFEALGISYGAAYLKAVPARDLTAEPFDAIAQMAERLADRASAGTDRASASGDRTQASSGSTGALAAQVEVVEQFGIRMRNVESNGRMRICYDGELFQRVLSAPELGPSPDEQARAVLALTRPDCVAADVDPNARLAADLQRARLLELVKDDAVDAMTRSRLHARRAVVWAAVAYQDERRQQTVAPAADTLGAIASGTAGTAAQRARAELLAVHPETLGDDRRAEYLDAVLRVGAVRWAEGLPSPKSGPLTLSAAPGDPGQTCVALHDANRPRAGALIERCTYGLVRMASVQVIPRGPALVLAVQPLENWRELWVFHESAGSWTVDVLCPGLDDPDAGYVDFAGYVPASRRLLIAREVKARGRFHRSFEELRLDDLALVRQAGSPEILPDFGRWQDVGWRRDTLALH
jgi:hypothetical protein